MLLAGTWNISNIIVLENCQLYEWTDQNSRRHRYNSKKTPHSLTRETHSNHARSWSQDSETVMCSVTAAGMQCHVLHSLDSWCQRLSNIVVLREHCDTRCCCCCCCRRQSKQRRGRFSTLHCIRSSALRSHHTRQTCYSNCARLARRIAICFSLSVAAVDQCCQLPAKLRRRAAVATPTHARTHTHTHTNNHMNRACINCVCRVQPRQYSFGCILLSVPAFAVAYNMVLHFPVLFFPAVQFGFTFTFFGPTSSVEPIRFH